jgi:Mycoplasma protein of unknown function, DUF285.
MKTNLFDKKALAFFGTAAVLLAAVFTAGCKADVNDGGSKSDYATVPFGENGKDLKEYLQKLPDGSTVHKIEVTGLKKEDLKGGSGDASSLGKMLKDNLTKKVVLKLPKIIDGLTDMTLCFYGCTNLVQAPELPATVTTMSSCFQDCIGLIQSPALPAAVTDMSYCFAGCKGLSQSPKIPDAVKNMRYCFEGCKGLSEAPAIPAAVENMSGCFSGCTGLTQSPKIPNPNSVTNMEACFQNCTGLTHAPELPSAVTNMGFCFSGCENLTQTSVIPDTVTNMKFCFYGCKKITTVTLKCSYGGDTNFKDAFKGCTGLKADSIKVPSAHLSTYTTKADKMGTTAEKFAAE